MSVETRGRQAAEGLRRATIVDVESGLVRVRRTRRRRDLGRLAIAAVVLAAAVGGVLAVRDRGAELEPVNPGPVHNGEIVPPTQGEPGWEAFDQPSGSFLYFTSPEDAYSTSPGDYTVVGKDGELAQFECPLSSGCGGLAAFGPGPQQVSMFDPVSGELHVLGYDGATRDTINLRDALAGETPSSIAWSHDGSRLAVGTDCEHATTDCQAHVFIIDRDGGSPKVVHTEPAPTARVEGGKLEPLLQDLAWSPDGDTLTFIVHTDDCGAASDVDVWPHLVALNLQAAGATDAKTLHVYDDINCHGDLFPVHYPAHYNYAWAPDGTRLAVTTSSGYSEISATNGKRLAQHQLDAAAGMDFVTGPLAWLRAP